MIAVPVAGGDAAAPVGSLVAVSSEPDAFGDRERRVLEVLAGMVGAALSLAGAVGTRQARLEERTRALQESEARFKQLVDAAQEGIWVLDDRGVTTYVNGRLAAMLGYEGGELLGRALAEFAEAGTRPEVERRVGRNSGPRASSGDVRLRRKDGSELWAIMATSPIIGRDGGRVGTVGMLTDITERKRAEEGLHRSAERLRLLHEIDQAVLGARTLGEVGRVALSRLRRLVPCHRCSALLFDFDRGEAQLFAGFVGNDPLSSPPIPLSELSPTETLRLGTARYIPDLAAVERRAPYLDRLLADGIRCVLTVPLLVDGEVVGELNLATTTPDSFEPEHRDMAQELALPLAIAAQQARLRADLRQQTAELEMRLADRTAELRAATAELDTLAYAITHELRAPLRRTSGFAQILLEEHASALGREAVHYAEQIRDGARMLGDVLDGLAQLARVGRQDLLRRPTALGHVVDDVRRELEPEADGRDLRWQVGELPVVVADPALLRIAVVELLGNAIKFTGGRDHAVIRVFCVREDDRIGFGVADNGAGFDPAHAGRLGEPFARLHRSDEFPGMGIGLALVERIARRHGGELRAEGEPGGGATFSFTVAAER
jgi:PAS domain S-box-containing protein